jgi:hypothetical protein
LGLSKQGLTRMWGQVSKHKWHKPTLVMVREWVKDTFKRYPPMSW